MKLNQLAAPLNTKTVHLIEIARALLGADPAHIHGGTQLTEQQQTQVAAICRFMQQRQVSCPTAAIAQMRAEGLLATPQACSENVPVYLRPAVASELRRRYPQGTLADSILKLLGAVQSFEHIHTAQLRAHTSTRKPST